MGSPRLLLAVLALAAVSTAGCGGSSSDGADPSGNPTDRAFAAEMVPHHRSAVAMAEVARSEATTPFVKELAEDIIAGQTREIAQLREADAALADAGVARGRLAGMDMGMAGMRMGAGSVAGVTPFDANFVKQMLPHHRSAIVMARIELTRGANAELKALAGRIIAAQQREVAAMEAR